MELVEILKLSLPKHFYEAKDKTRKPNNESIHEK
jgi:hypothetical protein